jgi:hypothetical protein
MTVLDDALRLKLGRHSRFPVFLGEVRLDWEDQLPDR